ncbi:hypothetical protein D3C75_1173310 [compost metagenome]
MGENGASKRALTRQRCQRAVLDEVFHPDDGVMAPVMGFAQLPEVQTSGEQRAIEARGELLHTSIQRIHA